MNRGLLIFALMFTLVGAASGYYPITAVGVLLLIPALLSGPRRPAPRPTPHAPVPGRITPRQQPQPFNPAALRMEKTPQQPPPSMANYAAPAPVAEASVAVTPVLFPTAMFPSFTQPVPGETEVRPRQEAPQQRDELVEAIAALAVLRLLSQGT